MKRMLSFVGSFLIIAGSVAIGWTAAKFRLVGIGMLVLILSLAICIIADAVSFHTRRR